MKDCWKWLLSFRPMRQSMICPYCERLEWRMYKTIEEFNLEGCIRCRLILANDLLCEPELIKNAREDIRSHRVYGRYD